MKKYRLETINTRRVMKKKAWSHNKHGKGFVGTYERLNGERVFNLSNGKKTFTFESYQLAKLVGWLTS